LAELLIRLKQFDKAEKLLKQFLDQEQKGSSQIKCFMSAVEK